MIFSQLKGGGVSLKKTIIIGLTGPSGAGKSTLCGLLKSNDFNVVDADKIAKRVLDSNPECVKKLVEFFGLGILTDDLKIDRKALASKAFSSIEATETLNRITHPFIFKEIKKQVDNSQNSRFIAVIIDAPLLFESGVSSFCHKTISVLCDKNIRKMRIIDRDNLSECEAKKRLCAQKDDGFYESNSDFAIYNSGDKFALVSDFNYVFNHILENFYEASN